LVGREPGAQLRSMVLQQKTGSESPQTLPSAQRDGCHLLLMQERKSGGAEVGCSPRGKGTASTAVTSLLEQFHAIFGSVNEASKAESCLFADRLDLGEGPLRSRMKESVKWTPVKNKTQTCRPHWDGMYVVIGPRGPFGGRFENHSGWLWSRRCRPGWRGL